MKADQEIIEDDSAAQYDALPAAVIETETIDTAGTFSS